MAERFPSGDRGGNSIPTVQDGNLHSLWDGLLGKSHKPNDVKRRVAELHARPELFRIEPIGDIELWIQESHDLAKAFAYSPVILQETEQPGELGKINLRPEYLRGAGDHARRRIAAAGVRPGVEIKALPISPADLRRVAESPLPVTKLTPPEPTTLSGAGDLRLPSQPPPSSATGDIRQRRSHALRQGR